VERAPGDLGGASGLPPLEKGDEIQCSGWQSCCYISAIFRIDISEEFTEDRYFWQVYYMSAVEVELEKLGTDWTQ
jgi:hypothetical protein